MQERECRNFNKRGFTLVELIIVIAILAIIMLIASLAYGGIQQRMKVRSDKATCSEIGKALAVREADLDKSKGIRLYPEVVEYDSLELVENYIKPGLTPQSMPDGGYIVTAIQTDTGKKILVGIGKNDQEISTDLYQDNTGAGWAWTEGKEISKFIEENNSKFTPVKTLAGITGGSTPVLAGNSGLGWGCAPEFLCTESGQMARISYRTYNKDSDTPAICGIHCDGGYWQPFLISLDANGCLYHTYDSSYGNCAHGPYSASFTYIGKTWYYFDGDYGFATDDGTFVEYIIGEPSMPTIISDYPLVDDRTWSGSATSAERGIALLEYAGVYLVP